jgi:hypothetical protein
LNTRTLIKRVRVVFIAAVMSLGLAVAIALPASANTRYNAGTGYTLINQPGTRVCHGHTFTVGVWAQSGTSLKDRWYNVYVQNPNGTRDLFSKGYAPESPSPWRLWHIRAGVTGWYHTTYVIWHGGHKYTSKYATLSHSC